jgi:hypothetical protein
MVKGTLKKHFFHRYLIALLSLFIFQNSFGQDSYRFKCKDNPKCNGVEFSINIPKKFNPLEGDRPHIIKKFVFQENNFSTTIILYLRKLPMKPSNEEINKILSLENIYKMNNVIELIEYDDNANIDNQKCLTATIYNEAKVYTNKIYNVINQNLLIWEDNLIQVNFFVTTNQDNYEKILNYYDSNKHTFNSIMSSFVLTSKWKNK